MLLKRYLQREVFCQILLYGFQSQEAINNQRMRVFNKIAEIKTKINQREEIRVNEALQHWKR